jgi:hypothetical protein
MSMTVHTGRQDRKEGVRYEEKGHLRTVKIELKGVKTQEVPVRFQKTSGKKEKSATGWHEVFLNEWSKLFI